MTAHLIELVAGLRGARLGVVGDVMLDRFVYGEIERISPEAPIPVLKHTHTREMLGGAGNVAANGAALGAQVTLAGLVGADEAGAAIRRLLAGFGEGAAALVTRTAGPTTIKTRLVARQQQMLRLDVEQVAAPDAVEWQALLDAVAGALPRLDVLLLSDYAKGVLLGDLPARIIALAAAAGVPVVVDPKGRDFARYRGARVVTPNLRELREATDLPCAGDAGVVAAARRLIADHGIGAVLATRSEAGMSVVTADTALHLPATARDLFDVSGAGDTVAAVLACALARGVSLEDAARLANVAAGIVVGKPGTAQVDPDELMATLRLQQGGATDPKIVSRHEAANAVERWRRQGSRVGFTNGCFDLLHPGHLSLLRQARQACDRLVVGLNSDESIRRLKGPDRPIQTESARAAVLACLELVDLVVLFTEDTPLELLTLLRPDLLVKGADYRLDQVVGADLVQGWGGRVLLADLADGFSTSNTVRRMRQGT